METCTDGSKVKKAVMQERSVSCTKNPEGTKPSCPEAGGVVSEVLLVSGQFVWVGSLLRDAHSHVGETNMALVAPSS